MSKVYCLYLQTDYSAAVQQWAEESPGNTGQPAS